MVCNSTRVKFTGLIEAEIRSLLKTLNNKRLSISELLNLE